MNKFLWEYIKLCLNQKEKLFKLFLITIINSNNFANTLYLRIFAYMKTFNDLKENDIIYFLEIHPNAVNGNRFKLHLEKIVSIHQYDVYNEHRLNLSSGYAIDVTDTNGTKTSMVFSCYYAEHVIAIPYDVDCSETILRNIGLKYIKHYTENQIQEAQGRINRAKARYESSLSKNTSLIEKYKERNNDLSLISDNLRHQIAKLNQCNLMKNRHV